MAEGAEIARAYVLVVPSLQGAQKRLTEELVPDAERAGHEAGTKGGAKFQAAMSAAAKASVAVMAAAAAAAVKLIKDSVMAYAESEQLTGGIQKLFGDAADTVLEASKRAYETAGMSANDYLQQVTGISAALLKSGISAEEAAVKADEAMRQIADNANTFGRLSTEQLGEVYSALARGSYQVLDQLSLGYAGTKAGLNDLIRDANAYAKATGRAAGLSADSFADVVTAIGLIQEKTGIAGTTAMEAEHTISGSLSRLSASWENLVAGFGDPAADVESLVASVMSSLESVVRNITPVVQRIAASLTTAIPSLVSQVAAMVPTVLPDLLEAVVTLATSVAEELPNIIETLMTVLTDNSEMLIGAAIDIAMALVNASPRLITVLVDAIPRILFGEDGNGGFIGELLKAENIESFILAAIAIATALVEAVPRIVQTLIVGVPKIVNDLADVFQSDESKQAFIEAGQALGQALLNGIINSRAFQWISSFSPLGSGHLALAKQIGEQTLGTSVSVPNYSGAALDTGGWDGLAAQRAIAAGTTYNIGTMNLNASDGATAASVFRQIRQAAALG